MTHRVCAVGHGKPGKVMPWNLKKVFPGPTRPGEVMEN